VACRRQKSWAGFSASPAVDRLWCRGYRVTEVPLPPLPEVKKDLRINFHSHAHETDRPVVRVSLGCEITGVALPQPCPNDPVSTAAGVQKRFGFAPPPFDESLREAYRDHVQKAVRLLFTPLPSDSDTSVETWLQGTSYPAHRKDELLMKWNNVVNKRDILSKKYLLCKSFVKLESYTDYKYPRAINSRSDEFKCLVGPIFKLIEKEVFKLKCFIKKVPMVDRPAYIKEMLMRPGHVYPSSDYTSFEALFVKKLMEDTEFQLYDYMTSLLSEGSFFMEAIKKAMCGTNTCKFKNLTALVQAVRMSGEMCTSLGNGFSNLMFISFLRCFLRGENLLDVINELVLEGDDNLSNAVDPLAPEDFARLGLVIKTDINTQLSEASFCGLVFDEDDLVNVTNPLEVLASTGWAEGKYARSRQSKLKTLLRCKALSLAHQYPGCPVVGSFAQYLLRCTSGYDVRHVIKTWRNTYEREQLLEALGSKVPIRDVPLNTRLLVERLYGLSVERQHIIEKYFDKCEVIQPIPSELVTDVIPRVWNEFFINYVEVVDAESVSHRTDRIYPKPYEYISRI